MSPSAASGTLPRLSSVLADVTSIRPAVTRLRHPPPMYSNSSLSSMGSLDSARPAGGRCPAAALSDKVRLILTTIGSRQPQGKTLNPDGNVVGTGACPAPAGAGNPALDPGPSLLLSSDYQTELVRNEPAAPSRRHLPDAV